MSLCSRSSRLAFASRQFCSLAVSFFLEPICTLRMCTPACRGRSAGYNWARRDKSLFVCWGGGRGGGSGGGGGVCFAFVFFFWGGGGEVVCVCLGGGGGGGVLRMVKTRKVYLEVAYCYSFCCCLRLFIQI